MISIPLSIRFGSHAYEIRIRIDIYIQTVDTMYIKGYITTARDIHVMFGERSLPELIMDSCLPSVDVSPAPHQLCCRFLVRGARATD